VASPPHHDSRSLSGVSFRCLHVCVSGRSLGWCGLVLRKHTQPPASWPLPTLQREQGQLHVAGILTAGVSHTSCWMVFGHPAEGVLWENTAVWLAAGVWVMHWLHIWTTINATSWFLAPQNSRITASSEDGLPMGLPSSLQGFIGVAYESGLYGCSLHSNIWWL